MKAKQRIAAGAGVFALAAASLAAQTAAGDWPQWRGPNRDGVITGFTAPKTWPERLVRKWKVDVGLGYASPVVVGNRVYLFARQGEREILHALNADTGAKVWESGYQAAFQISSAAARHEKGPKSTPAFADGKLYTLGMTNIVTAFDAATGKQLWQKPATQAQPLYHTGMSPLVDRGLVILHVGGHDKGSLNAYDAATGAVKWHWDGDGPGYGSPMVADIEGTRQVIVLTQENVVGVAAATGELLWKRPFSTPYSQNAITPILYGGLVIVSGLDKGITAFRIGRKSGRWETENVWEKTDVGLYMTNGVIVNDTLVGLSHKNSGQFFALDARSGATVWKSAPRQAANAAISRAGDTLFVLKDDAELIVARSGPNGLETLRTYSVADSATWAQPAVSGNRIFVKDVGSLALWMLN
jgi:outer membrane protein assembly factor BamB